jgi:hypothetical protein
MWTSAAVSPGRTLAAHLPETIPKLGATVPALAEHGTATAEPFLIEGGAASAQGVLNGGIDRIRIHDRVVVRDLRVEGSLGVNFVMMPGALRRERTGPLGTVMENLVVTPALPLVAVQWSGSPSGDDHALRLTITPCGPRVRYDVRDGILRVKGGDPDRSVVVALCGGGGEWAIEDDANGRVLASHDMVGDGPWTLLVTEGSEATLRTALSAAAHLSAHERRAASPDAEGTRVLSGVAELDDGAAWASSRVRASLHRGSANQVALEPGHDPSRWSHNAFWSGLGALAVGDVETARRAVSLLEYCSEEDASQATWPVRAMAALLAARLALTSGDASPARHHAQMVLDPGGAPESLSPGAADLWTFALEELADAVRYAEADDRITQLRSTAAGLHSKVPRARQLPMVSDERRSAGSFLRSVLAGDSGLAPTTGNKRLDDALSMWSGFGEHTDRAWSRFRETRHEGLAAGPAGPASWDETDEDLAPGAPVAGAILAAFSHGVLGYMPDAPSGRLRLAPRIPSHVRALAVEGLRLGPTSIRLRYERSEMRHRFTLEPTSARVPPQLVLEPSIPGTRLAEAQIGGAPADLEAIVEGDRLRVRVQLPLEGACTIDLRTE